jgi:hypothetical protein
MTISPVDFNKLHPVGSKVRYVEKNGEISVCTIESPAFISEDGVLVRLQEKIYLQEVKRIFSANQ